MTPPCEAMVWSDDARAYLPCQKRGKYERDGRRCCGMHLKQRAPMWAKRGE